MDRKTGQMVGLMTDREMHLLVMSTGSGVTGFRFLSYEVVYNIISSMLSAPVHPPPKTPPSSAKKIAGLRIAS